MKKCKNIVYVVYFDDKHESFTDLWAVFDYLISNGVPFRQALKALSWCNIAPIGDYYIQDDFSIETDFEDT